MGLVVLEEEEERERDLSPHTGTEEGLCADPVRSLPSTSQKESSYQELNQSAP